MHFNSHNLHNSMIRERNINMGTFWDLYAWSSKMKNRPIFNRILSKIQVTIWAHITGILVVFLHGEAWIQMIVNDIFALVMNSFEVILVFVVSQGTFLSRHNCGTNQIPGAQFFMVNYDWSTFSKPYTLLISSTIKWAIFPLIFIIRVDSFTTLR